MIKKIINLETMGKNIRRFRKEKELTQENLASLTDLSVQYIGNIERGNTTASIETIMKICNALDISPNQILLTSSVTSSNALINEISSMLNNKPNIFLKHIIAYIELLESSPSQNK